MVEIKFLKELPVRSLNKSALIELKGADIYVDKDANRFAYFGFKNYSRSPMFSLYLVIKQYDSFGSFIRETKFSLPSIYVPRGSYVTEKPIRISDDCEGCEVYIAYAEFATKQFYQDRLTNKSHLEDFTADYFAGAPASVTCSINSNIVIQKETPKAAPVEEAKTVEPFVKPAPEAEEEKASEPVSPSKEEVSDAVSEPAAEEEKAPVSSFNPEPMADSFSQEGDGKAKVKEFRKRLSLKNLILLGVCALCFGILAVVLYFIF